MCEDDCGYDWWIYRILVVVINEEDDNYNIFLDEVILVVYEILVNSCIKVR